MGNILIVTPFEDEKAALVALCAAVGLPSSPATTLEDALALLSSQDIHLALLRTRGDQPDDRALIRKILRAQEDLAVIAVVDVTDHQAVMEAAKSGAFDFIALPLNEKEAAIRVRMAVEKRAKTLEDTRYRTMLENMVMAKTEEIWVSKDKVRKQFIATISALLKALQARHVYTEGHSRRVADKAKLIAQTIGLDSETVRNIELGALFHDIGKLAIRDDVLNKNGKLTEEEYEHIKTHPLAAEQILSPLEDFVPVIKIIKHEHERWDGKGYPDGLAGEDIPLGARMVMIADAWDSLIYDRIYRQSCSKQDAIDELRRCAGTQFDPKLVEVFAELIAKPKPPVEKTETVAT
ncbi:MAG: hypothetical protein A2Z34_01890 [Planctomycetes bacterium RBG_16_59_8]|nr:MAG: hypothetical protein A2Z34_01890 [Planctomycetes bacterium RBG_16_59_8]